MGRKHLKPEDRAVIVHLHFKQGKTKTEICRETGYGEKAVRITIRNYEKHQTIKELPRSGRPRKSSGREDRTLVRLSLADRHLTSPPLRREWEESTGVQVSTRTVRRRLVDNGLKGCRARKKPLLTNKQRERRLAWAHAHKNWTRAQWQRVLFFFFSSGGKFRAHFISENRFVLLYRLQ